MGAELSCDVCGRTLDEDADNVWVRTASNGEDEGGGAAPTGEPASVAVDEEHVCEACYDNARHPHRTLRRVYFVVGEENLRRLKASGQAEAHARALDLPVEALGGYAASTPSPTPSPSTRDSTSDDRNDERDHHDA